jgi:hypothetical protein
MKNYKIKVAKWGTPKNYLTNKKKHNIAYKKVKTKDIKLAHLGTRIP